VYLKRITVTGFKSFASKTVLDLEPGMTAVVGPNGSGKSNIADAIRWALGEQNKSRLRLGERDEVVFAGSDKRARASLAEVTLLFNNDNGTFPLDLTEVEISRRLYRSGESEYCLAGRPIKLAALQQLLAEAGFGVGSYAVIGQGTIDSLLLSSPAERKLLFDEAAGIRGAELGREASVRKLAATETNLVRLRDIATELAPRAASLERTRNVTRDRDRLATRVTELRSTWLATALAELKQATATCRDQIETADRFIHRLRHESASLKHDQDWQLARASTHEAQIKAHRRELQDLERARDEAALILGAAQSRATEAERTRIDPHDLKRRQARLTQLATDLAGRIDETSEELQMNKASARRAQTAIEGTGKLVSAAQSELIELRQQLSDGTRHQYVSHALALVKSIAVQLDDPTTELESLRLLVHKTGRLLSHASRTGEAELAARLKVAQAKLEAAMAKRETATEHQTNVTLTRRSLEIEQAAQVAETERLAAEREQLQALQLQLDHQDDRSAELVQTVRRAEEALKAATTRMHDARSASEHATAAPADAVAQLAVRLERVRQELATARQERDRASELRKEYRQQASEIEAARLSGAITPGIADLASGSAQLAATLSRLEGELDGQNRLAAQLDTEYDEVTTRQRELTDQITDLEVAKADLETMVDRLGQLVQTRFRENFARLNTEFARQAERLFAGGNAGLELTEDDDGKYGIVIKLNPKGKRLASLAALSGGERALAGVALLAAILAVNPSPFIVLDEIDAALDDANAGRLSEIMATLAATSQLIVITHNRQTMKAAKVLFGVTMNDHHVSHLLSLHLEEATQLAAR
jgi:chromosome segregation protein